MCCCGGFSFARKSASHFSRTAAPSETSPLAVYEQSWKIFMLASHVGAALITSTVSSRVSDLPWQIEACAGAVKPKDATKSKHAAIDVRRNIVIFPRKITIWSVSGLPWFNQPGAGQTPLRTD